MKSIILVITTALLLAGCSINFKDSKVTPNQLRDLEVLCRDNGGISAYWFTDAAQGSTATVLTAVDCGNGASFYFGLSGDVSQ